MHLNPEPGADCAVVVPVYNRRRTVLRTLDSIAAQSLAPGRLIVVDDGSSDDTRAVVAAWLKDHLHGWDKHLLRTERGGAAAARNFGLAQLARFEFVNFLDSDDALPPDFLARTLSALRSDPEAVAASTARLTRGPEGDVVEELKQLEADPVGWFFVHGAGVASCTLLRIRAVLKLGGFPTHVPTGHDLALFARLARRGSWRVVSGAPTLVHRQGPGAAGEAGNLSLNHPRRWLHWARTRQELLEEERARGLGRDRHALMLGVVQRNWHNAGREAAWQGDRRSAARAYCRSLGCFARMCAPRLMAKAGLQAPFALRSLIALSRLPLQPAARR